MDSILKIIIALAGICAGLLAIIKLVPQFEIAIALISLTFGIMALIWTNMARKSLSVGSSLKEYALIFMNCIFLIILYSLWDLFEGLLNLKGAAIYPKYFFISAAYLLFVFAGYKMLTMSQEFGFGEKSQKIEAIIKSNVKKKK